MDFGAFLKRKFVLWRPDCPEVKSRTKYSVELSWKQADEPFGFLRKHLLYKVQRKDKIPPWTTVYSGGMTTKIIDNLAPTHPYKFRLQVILKATSVPKLEELVLKHYGDELKVHEAFDTLTCFIQQPTGEKREQENVVEDNIDPKMSNNDKGRQQCWIESAWSEETWTSTEYAGSSAGCFCMAVRCGYLKQVRVSTATRLMFTRRMWTSTEYAGSSAGCFCMAVRCGYLKQVQQMLETRPELIGIVNSANGLTPLASAVKKGDINVVRFLLDVGANVNQCSISEQTPLHIAVFYGHVPIVDLLLERGADPKARDINGLQIEHYAVDSGQLEILQHILNRGGNVHATDNSGWTPLFRAVVQGAATSIVEALVSAGAEADLVDRAGLSLPAAARVLMARGERRDSLLRLVDAQFAHDKALAHFTRITKKISSVHSLFKQAANEYT